MTAVSASSVRPPRSANRVTQTFTALAQATRTLGLQGRTRWANDVPYTETSLLRAWGIVISYLNRVGLAARDSFRCPVAGQLGRV